MYINALHLMSFENQKANDGRESSFLKFLLGLLNFSHLHDCYKIARNQLAILEIHMMYQIVERKITRKLNVVSRKRVFYDQ